MGKIKTEGRVTLEFEPDLYEISITVRTAGKTSGMAVDSGKNQTEMLMQLLCVSMDIQPEQLTAESEEVSVPYRDEDYVYSRTLLLKIPADNRMRESVTKLISEMNDVSYNVQARISDESKKQQAALDAAVQAAKEKAERLAASMHCRITGFDEICTDGTHFNACADTEMFCGDLPKARNMAAELQNPKIPVTGTVTVVWLTEPLT